jgi:CRP/FNR family transcriptional regulator
MPLSQKAIFLKGVSIFSSFTLQELEILGDICYERRFGKDQFIVREGDEPQSLLILKEGTAKALKQSVDGNNVVIRLICPKDIMGEVAIFNDTLYPASAQALCDTVVYEIPKESLFSLIKEHPNILYKIIGVCTQRLSQAYTAIDGLGTKRIKKQVAIVLLSLANTIGKREGNHIRLDASISRQDLAEMVGRRQESVCRVMATLKREGIILSSSRKIAIIDPNRLSSIAEEVEE